MEKERRLSIGAKGANNNPSGDDSSASIGAFEADKSSDLLAGDAYIDDYFALEYRIEINNTMLLKPQEEIDLAKRIQRGRGAKIQLQPDNKKQLWLEVYPELADVNRLNEYIQDGLEARKTFINANLRLVLFFAKNMTHTGVPFQDLVQYGNIGLIRAVDRFDPNEAAKGVKFSTYAGKSIKRAILRGIGNEVLIRIPANQVDTMIQIKRKNPNLTNDEIEAMLQFPGEPISLDSPFYDDSDATLGDITVDPQAVSVEDEAFSSVSNSANVMYVREMLEALNPSQKRILIRRYGLDGEGPHSLEEVASEIGITRQGVEYNERQALRALKALMR